MLKGRATVQMPHAGSRVTHVSATSIWRGGPDEVGLGLGEGALIAPHDLVDMLTELSASCACLGRNWYQFPSQLSARHALWCAQERTSTQVRTFIAMGHTLPHMVAPTTGLKTYYIRHQARQVCDCPAVMQNGVHTASHL